MSIEIIRGRLAVHRPEECDSSGCHRAAVALILRDAEEGTEFLAIQRSERPGDPWSGHMALPGGRQHPSDQDLFATAARETKEEVGIDLHSNGELLGYLDHLRAIGDGRPLDLIITPFVCALNAPVSLSLNSQEVQTALWIPLSTLYDPEGQGHYTYRIGELDTHHQAFVYQGYTIWGLTYRILTQLLQVLR